jgi:hypothetical protein
MQRVGKTLTGTACRFAGLLSEELPPNLLLWPSDHRGVRLCLLCLCTCSKPMTHTEFLQKL